MSNRDCYSGMQVGIDIGNESEGCRLTVGGYSAMQVDIDICNQSDGYLEVFVLAEIGMVIVLQWEYSRGMPVGTAIGNESDGYRFTVGEYAEGNWLFLPIRCH